MPFITMFADEGTKEVQDVTGAQHVSSEPGGEQIVDEVGNGRTVAPLHTEKIVENGTSQRACPWTK